MKIDLETHIEELLNNLAKKDNEFLTTFDANNKLPTKKLKKIRTDLSNKYTDIKEFEKLNNCLVSIGPISFVFIDGSTRYLGYFIDNLIQVEKQEF